MACAMISDRLSFFYCTGKSTLNFQAIVFHQFCEGLGLASRIALLPTTTTLSKVMMYTAFIFTTPIGIAIGIGVRQNYNGNDRDTLLTIGVMDSISAGVLLYSSLVQIMVGDFINNKQMLWASNGRVFFALTCFTLGAIVMVSWWSNVSEMRPSLTLLFSYLFLCSQSVLGLWA